MRNAAASDVFGSSLYEPCGQIDHIGNLYGATAANRDTADTMTRSASLNCRMTVSLAMTGTAFSSRITTPAGLWYGLEKSVRFHRRPQEIRERQLKRIMKETRVKYGLEKMIDQYVNIYEKLNGGEPLA